jgi:serine/threonine protein kinase
MYVKDCFSNKKIFLIDTLKESLGSGGFGKVFAVENPNIKKKMAMKIIEMKSDGSSAISKSLDAELRVGIRLAFGCRFLVQITEYFIENGFCFLIMEYCCDDLGKYLKKNKQTKVKMSRKVFFLLHIIFLINYFFFVFFKGTN